MAVARGEIEYLKHKLYKDLYRGERPDGGASQASTSAPNSRPASARGPRRPTSASSSRPTTPAWSSAPSHPDEPPWPRPPLFAAPSSLRRPASARNQREQPRLGSEASTDVAAVAAVAAGEANVANAPLDAAPHSAVEAPARKERPASAPVGGRRPAFAPVGGRRGSAPNCSATPRARWQEQHLHYDCASKGPAYGSIYANRGPYPGPGTYYSPEDAANALKKGHTFSNSARPTGKHFGRPGRTAATVDAGPAADAGPSRPAGDPRLLYRPVPKFKGGVTRDKPVGGLSFGRSARM